MSARRGYLLIEVMVAGAITAGILAGALIMIGDARQQVVASARVATASSLLAGKLDEQRRIGFATLATGTTTEAPVAGISGSYTRITTVSAPVSETLAGVAVNYRIVDVTVVATNTRAQGSIRVYP